MIRTIFNKAILFSILGHLALFGLFSFSFGQRIPKLDFASVYSLGAILRQADLLNNKENLNTLKTKKGFFIKSHAKALVKANNNEYLSMVDYHSKPQFNIPSSETKIMPPLALAALPFVRGEKEQPLMFHPRLPEHFLLFFKDRQMVHIELMYNVTPRYKTNVITLKRKISSGNLEADLLSMRYIEHYLFIGQTKFVKNKWQTVKIDLSAKHD